MRALMGGKGALLMDTKWNAIDIDVRKGSAF